MKSSEKKSKRKIFKLIGSLLLIIFVGILLIGLKLWLQAPEYVNSKIVPGLGAKIGLPSLKFKARRLGLSEADLVEFSAANGSITADSVRLDYQLLPYVTENTLQINNITVSGIEADCKINNGRFEIRHFDLQKFINSFKKQSNNNSDSENKKKTPLKVKINEVILKNGLLKIENGSTVYHISFNARIIPENEFKQLRGNFEISLGTMVLKTNFFAKLDSHKITFESMQSFNLNELAAVLNLKNVDLRGKGIVMVSGGVRWNPFIIKRLSLQSYVEKFETVVKGQTFYSDSLYFGLTRENNALLFKIKDLKGQGLVDADFEPVTGRIDLNPGVASFECKIPATIQSLSGIKLPEKSPLKVDVKLSAKLHQGKLNAIASLNAIEALLPAGKLEIGATAIKLNGELSKLEINGKNDGMKFVNKLVNISFPAINMSAKSNGKKLSGSMNISKGRVTSDKFKIKTGDINLNCPFSYPELNSEIKLKCAGVYWDRMLLGSAEGNMKFSLPRSDYSLAFNVKPFESMKLTASGGITFGTSPEFDMAVVLPEYNITSLKGLKKRFPAVKDFNFTGKCNGGMKFKYKSGVPLANGFVEIQNGMLEAAEPGFKVSNIRLDLKIADLLKMRSLPKQRLNFDLIEAGDVKLVDGKVNFQIESFKSMLLERAKVGWCNGHIYTHALRIRAGINKYRATFYCDGIVLSELISQLGLSKATGSGTVLGRIPVRLDKNGLAFTRGYLYSVPGDTNKIKLMDTDKLLESIPKETQQFTQLDIATEALKDFNYKWVKLDLNTQGEDLRLKMELNGNAANILPFTYDKKKNAFIRVKSGGAKFQGIRLDINSNIPLNRLMLISNKLKKILGGAKSR